MTQNEPTRIPSNIIANAFRTPLQVLGLALAMILAQSALQAAPQQSQQDLAQEIFDTMVKIPGAKPATRPVHAKGIVCEGTFTATKAAAGLSSAAHLQGKPVPVTIRFSDGAPDPSIPDNSPNANPRGIAIRFKLADGDKTDIVALSHNGFIVANGEEFLALQKSILATDPSKPHPWPVEQFLGAHPRALKFVQDPSPAPVSFATMPFYSNNAFVFVNKKGVKQAFRYQILPVEGSHFLSDADAKTKSADYLSDDLRARLPKQPIKSRLVAQLPNAGDSTNDGTLVWPDDRKTVELGTITITNVVADSDAAQKAVAFDPTILTPGIELSDDELPALRSLVYGISAMHR
jgi:catalase